MHCTILYRLYSISRVNNAVEKKRLQLTACFFFIFFVLSKGWSDLWSEEKKKKKKWIIVWSTVLLYFNHYYFTAAFRTSLYDVYLYSIIITGLHLSRAYFRLKKKKITKAFFVAKLVCWDFYSLTDYRFAVLYLLLLVSFEAVILFLFTRSFFFFVL